MFYIVDPWQGGARDSGWTGFAGAGAGTPGLSNNNRTFLGPSESSGWCWRRQTSTPTGKRVMEVLLDGPDAFNYFLGFYDRDAYAGEAYPQPMGSGSSRLFILKGGSGGWVSSGRWNGASQTLVAGYATNVGQIASLLVDYSTGGIWCAVNGVVAEGDPVAGTGAPITLPDAGWDPVFNTYRAIPASVALQGTANFQASHLVYPFSGFEPFPPILA